MTMATHAMVAPSLPGRLRISLCVPFAAMHEMSTHAGVCVLYSLACSIHFSLLTRFFYPSSSLYAGHSASVARLTAYMRSITHVYNSI